MTVKFYTKPYSIFFLQGNGTYFLNNPRILQTFGSGVAHKYVQYFGANNCDSRYLGRWFRVSQLLWGRRKDVTYDVTSAAVDRIRDLVGRKICLLMDEVWVFFFRPCRQKKCEDLKLKKNLRSWNQNKGPLSQWNVGTMVMYFFFCGGMWREILLLQVVFSPAL